jgi:hypothetical protein
MAWKLTVFIPDQAGRKKLEERSRKKEVGSKIG